MKEDFTSLNVASDVTASIHANFPLDLFQTRMSSEVSFLLISENEANRSSVNGVVPSCNGNGIAGCELRVIPILLIRGGEGERFASNVPVTLFQRARLGAMWDRLRCASAAHAVIRQNER